jgi:hypothetical protein
MNDIASIYAKLHDTDPASSYVEQADRVLVDLNKRIVDLDADWRRRRRDLAKRYHDEVMVMDQQHDLARRRLMELVERIELLQE